MIGNNSRLAITAKAPIREISLLVGMSLVLIASCRPSFSNSVDSTLSSGSQRYYGGNTTLVIDTDTSNMRHDGQNNGDTSICLLSKGGSILFQRQLNDNYICLGYSSARHAFILRTLGEEGVWLKVNAFEYLPEDKPAIVYSKSFTHRYLAALEAVVPSPDLRFVVFVGRRTESSEWHLYVLDTKSDTVTLLGKAPNPPPLSKDYLEEAKDGFSPCDFWQWGFSVPVLEPNICQFISPHVLKVSYGEDTCRHRSKHRLIREWTLIK